METRGLLVGRYLSFAARLAVHRLPGLIAQAPRGQPLDADLRTRHWHGVEAGSQVRRPDRRFEGRDGHSRRHWTPGAGKTRRVGELFLASGASIFAAFPTRDGGTGLLSDVVGAPSGESGEPGRVAAPRACRGIMEGFWKPALEADGADVEQDQ